MRYLILVTAFLTFFSDGLCQKKEIGNLVIENIPEIPEALKERMNQYQNTRGAFPYKWSPDGKGMLMSTRFGETSQIHYIDHPGGARKQLTFFREPVTGGSFCPNPVYHGFMFFKDQGGNEFTQLFWFDLDNGKYEMLSDGGRSQNGRLLWSRDGSRFVYTSTRRNGKDYDLYLSKMTNPKESRLILQREGSWRPVDWSEDGIKIIVSNEISANKSLIYILNIESGVLEQFNPSEEEISYGRTAWSAGAKGIFYISDQGSEFHLLKYHDLAKKISTDITADIRWDAEDFIFNKERNTLIFAVNENGIVRLYKMDAASMKYSLLEGLPTAQVFPSEFHPEGKMFSMVINSTKSPSDIYTYDLESKRLTQWTFSEVGGLNNSTFVTADLIEYETFDSLKIPAFYYRPANTPGKIPVVIDIHGGPEGQSVPDFGAFRNFLINELGIAVIEPNVRGSAGYGKTYVKLDNGFKREESVKDIGKLLDWIEQQPELDASRVAVLGGSYGGYMVLASLANFNERIRCGIDVVGISNFVTFLEHTEDYRRDLRRVEYGDERIAEMREFLLKISPANNVDKITKPLLIVQGQNDPRVPMSESEQMKNKLQEKGNEVWYLLAKDEGHGFRKKENNSYMQWAMVLFLEKFLMAP